MALPLTLGSEFTQPLSILCLGAHSDDIEIGCGGTLLRLLEERPGSSIRWVVFSADDARSREAQASAAAFTSHAGSVDVTVYDFRESWFPTEWGPIKEAIAALATQISPDVVFAHRRDDEHQDHRTIGQLVWNHFRDHLIMEYEIAKFEGDLGCPNVFVPFVRTIVDQKTDLLAQHFGSQHDKTWFNEDAFRGLMALRGTECNAPSGFAEGFYVRKVVL
jgi:LmbE family N-acetylglucosaminyl deacetylase